MPVCAEEFRLFSVQAVLFTPSLASQFRTSAVLSSILPGFADRYNGQVLSNAGELQQPFMVPAGGVAEIAFRIGLPAVTLGSDDGRWKLESSPQRTDSFWQLQLGEDGRDCVFDICQQCLAPLLAYHSKNPQIQVGRVALVIRRWVQDSTPALSLAERFCKPEMVSGQPLRNSQSFELDNLKKYTGPSGRRVNSWVKCGSGKVHAIDAIRVEQDINTLAEESQSTSFDDSAIQEFFEWAPGHMDEVLRLYFPTEQASG